MSQFGTPYSHSAVKVMLLGSGELGKEIAIAFQRYGVYVIAVDTYAGAPAMQVAHRSRVLSMLDQNALRDVIAEEKPEIIVPEIEAIAINVLHEAENDGIRVIPSASAVEYAMNRISIRDLAANQLGLVTSAFRVVDNFEAFEEAALSLGYPFVTKPMMSSSGKGQSIVHNQSELSMAWERAKSGARGLSEKVICEEFISFDYEITLLTVRHSDGKGNVVTSICEPIGHKQVNGDYRQSWQPQPMSNSAKQAAIKAALAITEALGGLGLYGVEFFVKGDAVYFNEVSPRPHDTGMVTMISQNISEFALHVRAILGLPIPRIDLYGPSASSVILAEGDMADIIYRQVDHALNQPQTEIRIFGKPEVKGIRRLGVALSRGDTLEDALNKAEQASKSIVFHKHIQAFSL